jgi:hypothetical protein
MHGVWLVLYALLGKGFGYAGFPPFYVGELLLLFALAALALSRRTVALLRTPLGMLAISFMIWQLACTLPHLDTYGVDALRDSVIWAYAVFAWVAAALILRLPGFLKTIMNQFRRAMRVFLILGPLAWLATLYLQDWLPHWSGTTVSIPLVKGDEYCVHLAGALALVLQGFGPIRQGWVFLILTDVLLAMNVRSGLLAFVVAGCFAVLLRPRPERLVLIAGGGMMLIAGMSAFDFRFVTPRTDREFSLNQLTDSLTSVVSDSGRSDLEATKQWRLNWWRTIVDYTIDGPYFWMGKGYGINLADSDGFQVGTRDEPLRSPHSSHVTLLARSGVPGFILWLALQLTWAGLMLKSYFTAKKLYAAAWVGVFAWLLTYWLAFMVAAGFDVFLEGPMAGIPFWTIFGLGWGSHTLFRNQLERLCVREAEQVIQHVGRAQYAVV